MANRRDVLKLMTEKGLHVYVLLDRDRRDVYMSYRKIFPGRADSSLDTHYLMNNKGDVVFVGNKDDVTKYVYRN